MNHEPITSRELIAAYRSHARPSAAARERMLRSITAPQRAAPVRPIAPRRAPIAWIALAAAVTLVGLSAYLFAGARHDARLAPAELMMAPQVTPPTTDAVISPPPQSIIPRKPSTDASPSLTDPPPTRDESPLPITADPPPTRDESPTSTIDPPRPRPARPGGDQVLAELALIQSIKEALDADQPQRALTLVDRHTRTFARGTLIEEREALRVVALCAADDPRGPRAQQTFLRAHPRSAYADRVRSACPGDESSHFP